MTDEFPNSFDPTRCVLFLGAGFSADATNRSHNPDYAKPPVGSGLNDAMKELAGLPKDDPSDFTDTAGYAISEGHDLFGLLEELYTIKRITPKQEAVLKLPWWRIYTTNYDNSVSTFRANFNARQVDNIFDLSDRAPRQLRPEAVIHLHGSIAKCDKANVDKSLILTRRSYIEQRVKKSEWWDWFERDINTSQFIFFLGYDINDFEPASYLARHPDLKKKCHFILRTPKSPVAVSKVSEFGFRHSFELEGFVERLSRASEGKRPEHENELATFQYIDSKKDNKLPEKPTSAEIQELFAFGRFIFRAAMATLPGSEYVLFRKNSIKKSIDCLDKFSTLIIHSRTGNGKTILVDTLKVMLSNNSYNCFVLKGGVSPLPQDIAFIARTKKPVIFFPSYDSAVANIHLFDGMPEGANYIVEMSTGTLQVRMKEVQSRLQGKIGRVNVDKLDKDDINSLRALLVRGGLTRLSRSTKLKSGIEMRDFIISAYDDPEIAQRLRKVIGPLLEKYAARRIIIVSAILKAVGLPVEPAFIADATDEDPYSVLNSAGENVSEVMEYNLEKIEPHSSILSEHIIKKYIDGGDFTESIFCIVSEAARRIEEAPDEATERFRRARNILSSSLRFSFLEGILGKNASGRSKIKSLYERCRRDFVIQKEPLFWLQYSIFWQDSARLDLAESHMIEAYSRAEEKINFKTYQLDTNYLGLLCDIESQLTNIPEVSRFNVIFDKIETCKGMIDDGNHRGHVLKSFLKIEPMVSARVSDFAPDQAIKLTYSLNLVVDKLASLKPEDRAIWGTNSCKESLDRAVKILIEHEHSISVK